jgi:hypothetical protein
MTCAVTGQAEPDMANGTDRIQPDEDLVGELQVVILRHHQYLCGSLLHLLAKAGSSGMRV